MNDNEGHDNEVVFLDTRRKISKPAHNWLNDPRIAREGKQLVKTTAAFLLDSLEVDPSTLHADGAGFAIFPLNRSLLKDNGMTAEQYCTAVSEKVEKVTGMTPLHCLIRGHDRDDADAWLIYIL